MPSFLIDNSSSTASRTTLASNKHARGSGSGSEAETTDSNERNHKSSAKRARVKIPRPPGEAGRKDERGFIMIEALGLADNKKKYLAILVSLYGS
jgi:hypothetical protein